MRDDCRIHPNCTENINCSRTKLRDSRCHRGRSGSRHEPYVGYADDNRSHHSQLRRSRRNSR